MVTTFIIKSPLGDNVSVVRVQNGLSDQDVERLHKYAQERYNQTIEPCYITHVTDYDSAMSFIDSFNGKL